MTGPEELHGVTLLAEEAAALAAMADASSVAELERLRVEWLGRRGRVTEQLRAVGTLPADQRRTAGQRLNALRALMEKRLDARLAECARRDLEQRLIEERLDLTLPSAPPAVGRLHPVTRTRRRLEDAMVRLGFSLFEGPQVEDEWHNFEALNMPAEHPAREMHDTFYLPPPYLLRTHTSPFQVRSMKAAQGRLPLRVFTIGTTFRRDDDPTHAPQFMQMEGLLLDVGIGLGHLKGVVRQVFKEVFGGDPVLRIRPSFFPFTEPSVEWDMQCTLCGGSGCRVCQNTGFLELLGSGMVHPHVIRAGGYDPELVSGFAFGWGVDRLAMLAYGIDDIRLLYQNDLRLLNQL